MAKSTNRRVLLGCVIASLSAVVVSAVLHGGTGPNQLYSDIWSFWSRSWVSSGQVPYSTSSAFLEYPPVSGAILYAARMLGGQVASWVAGSNAGLNVLYTEYYYSISLFSFITAAGIAWSTWRLGKALGVSINPLYFLLPSMLIFSVYNFDLFNAFFIVFGLQLFVEKRRTWSAVSIGLAIATKFVAGLLVPIFFLEISGWKQRGRYLAISLAVAAATFVPIAIYNWGYFSQFLSFYSNWGLEDAWYIWIFGSPFSSAAKVFGYALMAVLLLKVYTTRMPLVERSFLALASYLLAATIYAPQFNVMLVPLIAVLALNTPWLYSMEVFNALIILSWFTVPATPTSGPTYPWTAPQVFALIRSASLGLVGLSVASSTGHSLTGWFSSRLRPKGGAGPTLAGAGKIGLETGLPSQNIVVGFKPAANEGKERGYFDSRG